MKNCETCKFRELKNTEMSPGSTMLLQVYKCKRHDGGFVPGIVKHFSSCGVQESNPHKEYKCDHWKRRK